EGLRRGFEENIAARYQQGPNYVIRSGPGAPSEDEQVRRQGQDFQNQHRGDSAFQSAVINSLADLGDVYRQSPSLQQVANTASVGNQVLNTALSALSETGPAAAGGAYPAQSAGRDAAAGSSLGNDERGTQSLFIKLSQEKGALSVSDIKNVLTALGIKVD